MFVVAILIIATPAMAYDTTKSCGCRKGDGRGVIGNVKELQGAAKDKVMNNALENKGVRELQKKLMKQGFMQKEPLAYIVPVETEDGLIEVQVAVIPFEKEGTEGKSIMYAYNPQTGENIMAVIEGSVVTQGAVECFANLAICLGTCVGCVYVCTAPIAWPACLACISACGGACALAYCACTDYCCEDLGNQWCCAHKCP